MTVAIESQDALIPESWERYLLSTRGHYLRPLKLATKAAAQKAAAKEMGLEGLPSLEQAAQELNDKSSARSAQKKWIDWSVRERGLPATLQVVIELNSRMFTSYHSQPQNDGFFLSLREHFAHATQEDYQSGLKIAQDSLQGPNRDLALRLCFVFPGQSGSLDRLIDDLARWNNSWALAAITDLKLAKKLLSGLHFGSFSPAWCPNLFAHFLKLFGCSGAELLADFISKNYLDSDYARSASRVLACLPNNVAFHRLLLLGEEHKSAQEALHSATDQFPALALTVLAKEGGRDKLCQMILAKNPGILPLPKLTEDQNTHLQSLLGSGAEGEAAPRESWPSVLKTPRWLSPKTFKPKTIVLEPIPTNSRLQWETGQREDWKSPLPVAEQDQNLYEYYQTLATWQRTEVQAFQNLVTCPREAGLTLIDTVKEFDSWYFQDHIRAVIARWELEALPLIRRVAQSKLSDAIPYISPYDDPELAQGAAEAFARLKSVKKPALQYLLKYPETTATALIPTLLGKSKKAREWARRALMALCQNGHAETVARASALYGPQAEEQVKPLLEFDTLDDLPNKMPELPNWCHPTVLKKPQLKSGGHLDGEGLTNLLLILAISTPDQPYAGIEQLKEACTADSLAQLAWSLFEAWSEAGSDSKWYWAFHSLGWFGRDETVRSLTPMLKKWPGEGAHARAVQGLDILTNIGSDLALMNLFGLSQKLKFKGLKNQAAAKVEAIAEKRGLTPDELGDRLVPSLGLAADGSLRLDYGPRTFVVGFDEKLKPYVKDETGKLRKSLPKPAKSDHPEVAESSYERFKALKKDVRAIANQQLVRLESAMVQQRRWAPEDFQAFFLDHPLIIHLARRMVWGLFQDGTLTGSFRVAEDGTLADMEDDTFILPSQGRIGLLHSLELPSEALESWSELFADYQLLQPFAQLSRDVYHPESEELDSTELTRLQGLKVETLRLLSLEGKGWKRGEALDNGIVSWIQKALPQGLYACLNFEDGLAIGDPTMFPEQSLQTITLHRGYRGWSSDSDITFGEISATDFSELIRDLEPLRATALS